MLGDVAAVVGDYVHTIPGGGNRLHDFRPLQGSAAFVRQALHGAETAVGGEYPSIGGEECDVAVCEPKGGETCCNLSGCKPLERSPYRGQRAFDVAEERKVSGADVEPSAAVEETLIGVALERLPTGVGSGGEAYVAGIVVGVPEYPRAVVGGASVVTEGKLLEEEHLAAARQRNSGCASGNSGTYHHDIEVGHGSSATTLPRCCWGDGRTS